MSSTGLLASAAIVPKASDISSGKGLGRCDTRETIKVKIGKICE